MSADLAGARPSVLPGVIRVFLGLLFMASAALKALDFTAFAEQVSYYGISAGRNPSPGGCGLRHRDRGYAGPGASSVAAQGRVAGHRAAAARVHGPDPCTRGSTMTFRNAGVSGRSSRCPRRCPSAKTLCCACCCWPAACNPRPPDGAVPYSRASTRLKPFIAGCAAGVLLALALEIAGFAIYAVFFRDHMMSNLEKKMLVPSPPGTPMPYDWQVRDAAGEPVDMARFKDQPLFLVFFSASCPKCEAQAAPAVLHGARW